MKVRCITAERALLGESPVWSAEEGAVYWVDILGRKLHRTNPDNHETRTWDLPGFAGMIALRRKGGLVVALEDGLYGFDPQSGLLDLLAAFEDDQPGNRPNDGKCDAQGRLWVGTMNKTDASRPTGNFYRIDPDLQVTKIGSGYCIPNGLAWSPDDGVMYHTDTRSNRVSAWDFDPPTGDRTEAREFFPFNRETSGGVDGAAMDTRGGYWAALYGGGRLIRVSPEGTRDKEIPLPVSQPTMPAFGGPDMKTIFITSASQNLSGEERESQPLAGGLLAVPSDVRGHEVYPFGG